MGCPLFMIHGSMEQSASTQQSRSAEVIEVAQTYLWREFEVVPLAMGPDVTLSALRNGIVVLLDGIGSECTTRMVSIWREDNLAVLADWNAREAQRPGEFDRHVFGTLTAYRSAGCVTPDLPRGFVGRGIGSTRELRFPRKEGIVALDSSATIADLLAVVGQGDVPIVPRDLDTAMDYLGPRYPFFADAGATLESVCDLGPHADARLYAQRILSSVAERCAPSNIASDLSRALDLGWTLSERVA